MAQDSWPSPGHNNRAVTDGEYEQLSARYSDDGVRGTPADSPVVTAGPGRAVTIRANTTGHVRGHHWQAGGSDFTLSLSANTSGSTRIDRVVLRLDRSDWTVKAAIRQGSAGSGAPAPVQDSGDTGVYEISLATVSLATNANSVTVTRGELYIGTRVRPATSTTLNDRPILGELAYEQNTGRMRQWTGSTWATVSSYSGEIDITSSLSVWSSLSTHILEERNGTVSVRFGTLVRTGNPFTDTSESRLPIMIPAQYRHPTRDQYVICYITGRQIGRAIVYSAGSDRAGQMWLTQHPDVHTGDNIMPNGASWVVN